MKRAHYGIVLTLFLAAGTPAFADLYGFDRITNNSSSILDQLSVNVTDAGGGKVDFKFNNNVGLQSTVAAIYFDDSAGTLTTTYSISQTADVDFSPGGSPGNLPAGNTISFLADSHVTADSPAPFNGLNSADDFVTIQFTLIGGKTFADIISALNGANLRLGAHVISLPDGQSDSYVSGPPTSPPGAVPSPTAGVLGLIGLACIGARRPRMRLA